MRRRAGDCFTLWVPGKATPLYLVYDGTALEGFLYRAVHGCPPALDDFRSYEALGRRYDQRDFFRGTGLSLLRSRERALAIARHYRLGASIATLDIRIEGIVWTASGRSGHVTVWAPPELLLTRVLECESYD